ncbi:MAG: hypothetical protein BEN19_08725 [Epulopiscium sp. Nuni2H_MBin003]|nr:MAG: hypothetical protein BEN19_08725 [Epulopiscium sp. Nuni2H_MBin003]
MIAMYRVLLILPTMFLVAGIMISTPSGFVEGINNIRLVGDTTLSDYFEIGGIGPALINAAVLVYVNILLLYKLDLKPNGIIIAALFLLSGFGLLGKSIYNTWPFYLGGWIYCKYHNKSYKQVVVINMLSTCLAPVCSLFIRIDVYHYVIGFMLMVIVGAFIGFIMPPISAHAMTMHSGYNLYNMGLAAGLVAMAINAWTEGAGYRILTPSYLYYGDTTIPMIILSAYCLIIIIIGYILNGKTFKGLKEVYKYPGRAVTDTIQNVGFGLTLVNMGTNGLVSIIYVIIVGGIFNAPIVAGICTIIGFSAFGKHIKNCMPIIIGATIASYIITTIADPYMIIAAALFATALAPIAGEFGALIGIGVGIIHVFLVVNVSSFHGGLMLYNNGLSTGIIATLFVPMMDAFKRERKI